jgi:glycosyltransferase involved in cell wall biosynthesis
LPSFDIYFQPSLWEAMSISILEAMAAGKSVVQPTLGEAPHLIEHVLKVSFKPRPRAWLWPSLLLAQDALLRRVTGEAAARKVAE